MNYLYNTKVSVRPGTVRHALLTYLAEAPRTLQDLAAHVKDRSSWTEEDKFYKHTWELVVRSGYAYLLEDHYVITPEGREKLVVQPTRLEKILADKPEKQAPAEKVKNNLFVQVKDNYNCPELGNTCDRAGAYDFKKFPSLINGKRVYAN